MFVGVKLPPNAILIEYIPGVQPIDLSNCSKHRLDELRRILHEFHEIGILYGDPKWRNMMVSSGATDRVLWIDFDSARVFSEDTVSSRQERLTKQEIEIMDHLGDNLVGGSDLISISTDCLVGSRL